MDDNKQQNTERKKRERTKMKAQVIPAQSEPKSLALTTLEHTREKNKLIKNAKWLVRNQELLGIIAKGIGGMAYGLLQDTVHMAAPLTKKNIQRAIVAATIPQAYQAWEETRVTFDEEKERKERQNDCADAHR